MFDQSVLDDLGISVEDINSLDRDQMLELLELTERWTAPTDHRFYYYVPNPVMFHFHTSNAKTRALLGGNRSGKSEAAVEDMSMQFLGDVPASLEGLIPKHRLDTSRRIRCNVIDYPNAFEKITWPKIQGKIPSDKILDVVKDMGRVKAITNSKGGFIEFMMYEQEVKKFQGTSRHACFYDEEPPQAIRDENLMRLVDTDGEEVFSMTPISEENTSGYMPTLWIYDEIFLKAGRTVEKPDPLHPAISDVTNPKGDINTHVFFANIYDNIAITRSAADRILSKFSKEEREAREKGHFMHLSGLIYKSYSDSIHLIPPFKDWYDPKTAMDYTLYIAIDPHPRTPHAVLFLVVRRDGWKAIVDELFVRPKTTKAFVQLIQAKCMNRTPELIIIDPLAKTPNPGDGTSFLTDLLDHGLYPIPVEASKDRDRGIIRVKEELEPNAEGIPGIQIVDTCETFRYEITHYRWQNWTKNTGTSRGEKNKPVDKDDHMMENFYRLLLLNPSYVPPYVGEDE